MKPMTYNQILNFITKEKGYGRTLSERVCSYFLKTLMEAVKTQNSITLKDFGEFKITIIKEHKLSFDNSRLIPAQRRITFTPSNPLKAFINTDTQEYSFCNIEQNPFWDLHQSNISTIQISPKETEKIWAKSIIQCFLNILIREVNKHEKVKIPNVGEFKISYVRAHKLSFDKSTNVPPKRTLIFSADETLKFFLENDFTDDSYTIVKTKGYK